MPAVSLTDHGSMAGAVQLWKATRGTGVKPVVGCEIYVADDRRAHEKGNAHLTLLAADNAGYADLIKLSSLGYLEGYYYKPRVHWELSGDSLKNPDRWKVETDHFYFNAPEVPADVARRKGAFDYNDIRFSNQHRDRKVTASRRRFCLVLDEHLRRCSVRKYRGSLRVELRSRSRSTRRVWCGQPAEAQLPAMFRPRTSNPARTDPPS